MAFATRPMGLNFFFSFIVSAECRNGFKFNIASLTVNSFCPFLRTWGCPSQACVHMACHMCSHSRCMCWRKRRKRRQKKWPVTEWRGVRRQEIPLDPPKIRLKSLKGKYSLHHKRLWQWSVWFPRLYTAPEKLQLTTQLWSQRCSLEQQCKPAVPWCLARKDPISWLSSTCFQV